MAFDPAKGTAADVRGLALWFDEGDDGAIRVRLRGVNLPLREALSTTTGDGRPWDADKARAELVTLWGEDRGPVEYHAVVWRIVATLLGMLSREGRWRWALARAVIDEAAGLEPALRDAVGDNLAVQRLVDAVGASLERFGAEVREALLGARYGSLRAELGNVETDTGLWMAGGDWRAVEADLEAGGVLWLDEAGAAWLEREARGVWGRNAADDVREKAKERADFWRDHGTLGGWERDAAKLWRLWFDPDRSPVPVPFARSLALALWIDEVGPTWARGRRAELGLSREAAGQLVMFGTGRKPSRRVEVSGALHDVYDLEGGRELLIEVPFVSDELAAHASDGRAGIGLTELRLLHYVPMTLYEQLRDGGPWDGSVRIARGRKLAIRLGMGDDAKAAKQADAAVVALSRYNLRDKRGNLVGLWGRPDEEAHAPGRDAAFILSLRELMIPYRLRRLEDYRVVMPLMDTLPDDKWTGARNRADVARLAFGMAGAWRDRAGERHGALWLGRPGVPLTDELWRAVGQGLDRDEVLEQLTRSGWWTLDGALIVPGPALPLMRDGLTRSAEIAKEAKRTGGRRKARKPRG
jgi:hypothetical protein